MTPEHSHLLDGVLHDGCPMCDEIRRRLRQRAVEAAAERRLDHLAEIARRRYRPAPRPEDVP